MEDESPAHLAGPLSISPASAAWFCAALAELGQTKNGFAAWLMRHGDGRGERTILRSIQRMSAGDARVSGEMRVILTMLLQSHQKRAKAKVAA
jgi:hypothetical protein